jgi:hypothetical protein
VRNFAVRGEELTLERIEEILRASGEIEELVVWGGPLNNKDLAFVQRLPLLKSLVLGEMRVDDGIFEYLRHLPRLEYLVLAYTAVAGDFTPLRGLPLRDVRLEGCRFVGDACAQTLAVFPTLRQLELHMTGVTDAGVRSLADLPLEVLWLGPRVTDTALVTIASIATLRHLDICAHNVTDEGVAALTNLPLLNKLWLTRCGITDACVEALSRMKALRELNVNHTGITEAGMTRLQRALPACKFPEPD